jgi:DnaJ-class molecular chaperone
MEDPVKALKTVLQLAEMAQRMDGKLTSVRLAHESTEQTLERVIKLAAAVICTACRGSGGTFSDNPLCLQCEGTGNILKNWELRR